MKTWRAKSGQVITEKMTEAWADEAEKGYDLSKWKVRKVGRPLLDQTGQPSKRVQYRVAQATYEQAVSRAESAGLTISDVSRTLLQAFAHGKIKLP